MADCLFCKIAAKQIPSRIIVETPEALAFHDVSPQAPVHALVIPRKHIATLNDLTPADGPLVGRLFEVAKEVAVQLGVAGTGWRAVFNVGKDANQTVLHIHLHVLGGRALTWPPG